MKHQAKARSTGEMLNATSQPKSYPAPWKGQILLACSKCEKKLRRHGPGQSLGKLKSVLKQLARKDRDQFRLKLIKTPCLKLCPKGGVTVCTQAQLVSGQCSILRSSEDVEQIYYACKRQLAVPLELP